jgi:UPF0042 nucleotide-binding protein
LIALSGLSGAGKSTAAKALEDLGYFVVDNLPAELLLKLVDLAEHGHQKRPLAFVIDSREAEHLSQFIEDWRQLGTCGVKTCLWFLDASDATLIKRFQETRRPHPLDRTGQGLAASIDQERLLLADLKNMADQVIHTDQTNSHDLKAEIARLVGAHQHNSMVVRLMSFGFKYGLPQELDLCLDVRFLKNPYFVESLKPLSGLDTAVREFVLSEPNTKLFLDKTLDLLKFLIPCYKAERKNYLTIAIGCTGGRHRSPALVCEIARQLELAGLKAHITHRDLQK